LDSTTSAAGFGGGAGGLIATTAQDRIGGNGACRLIWGAGRAFPATRTADEVPSGNPSPPPPVAVLPSPPPPVVVSSPPPPPVVVSSPPPPPVVVSSPPPPPVVVSSPPPPPVVVSSPPPPPVVVSSPPPPPVVASSPPPPPAGPVSTGQVVFGAPGTYQWTPPNGVTAFSFVCIGGGGGAGTYVPSAGPSQVAGAGGGGGGALVWATNIAVTAGAEFTVVVGDGGRGNNGKGGDSSISRGTTLLAVARGGEGSPGRSGGAGGSWQLGTVAGGGGAGGFGGFQVRPAGICFGLESESRQFTNDDGISMPLASTPHGCQQNRTVFAADRSCTTVGLPVVLMAAWRLQFLLLTTTGASLAAPGLHSTTGRRGWWRWWRWWLLW
jgi:hypothetical protein